MSIIAGCTIEESFIQGEDNNSKEEQITIQAIREGDPETRTVRKSDGKVWWVPGDAISLFYGSGTNGGSKFTSTGTDTTQVTNFTGTITAITGGGELTVDDTYFWGVYPYNDDVSCDGTSVTMTIPNQQKATPGTFATDIFPSIGRSQGLIMGFYNVCGGWRFSVTKEGVRKVTLKSANGEKIAGKVKVGFNSSGIPEIKEYIDCSDEVVLECPQGEYFEVGKNYFMTLLPTVFNSGFTMTFETYTEEGVYNRTAKTTITRSNFSGIANLDNYLTTPYTQKTGNIPVEDANFKAYLVENFDGNGDGEISYEEAASITSINVVTDNIMSALGIEYMPGLNSLHLYGGSYSSTTGASGKLEVLDVSNNTTLTILYCYHNQLTTLDVSKNTKLTRLLCDGNQLTALDVSKNTSLTRLDCAHNKLTILDVSKNTALTNLNSNHNQLTSLDLSNNMALTGLGCSSNQLTSLDVTNNTTLNSLNCGSNQLTALDVSKNTALTQLFCGGNQLTALDVSKNTALTNLDCFNNQLTNLDVSKNIALTDLNCNKNQLTNLDVSSNTALTDLWCFDNQITNLSVSNNLALQDLRCGPNKLSSLDVSNNAVLLVLQCSNNMLTDLDVTHNSELVRLVCNHNYLSTLDVSKNTVLNYLDCSFMNDLDGNNLLATLYIFGGQEIPYITSDRNINHIPPGTQIVVKPESGGSEGTGDEELNP